MTTTRPTIITDSSSYVDGYVPTYDAASKGFVLKQGGGGGGGTGPTGPTGPTGATGPGGGGSVTTISDTPSTSQDNWSPTSFSTANVVRITPTANTIITGLDATASVTIKILINTSSLYTVTLKHLTTSTSTNQIFVAGLTDLQMNPGDVVWVYYDPTSTYWRVV